MYKISFATWGNNIHRFSILGHGHLWGRALFSLPQLGKPGHKNYIFLSTFASCSMPGINFAELMSALTPPSFSTRVSLCQGLELDQGGPLPPLLGPWVCVTQGWRVQGLRGMAVPIHGQGFFLGWLDKGRTMSGISARSIQHQPFD